MGIVIVVVVEAQEEVRAWSLLPSLLEVANLIGEGERREGSMKVDNKRFSYEKIMEEVL